MVIEGDIGEIFIAENEDTILGFILAEQGEAEEFLSVMPHKYAAVVDFFAEEIYRRSGIENELIMCIKKRVKETRIY